MKYYYMNKRKSLKKTPPPPKNGKIMAINKQPSFGSTIMDGMALGVGSSLGHRAMDVVLGPRQVTIPQSEGKSSTEFCTILKNKHQECLEKMVTSALIDCRDLDDLIIKYNCT